MIRIANLSANSNCGKFWRQSLTALLLTVTAAAWGCGSKEAPPPPGAEGQSTTAPKIDLPSAEPTTPPAEEKDKK